MLIDEQIQRRRIIILGIAVLNMKYHTNICPIAKRSAIYRVIPTDLLVDPE